MKQLIAAAALAVLLLPSGIAGAQQQAAAPASSNDLLLSKDTMESLTATAQVTLDSGRILNLEPGVRVSRVDGGYLFSTYGNKPLEIETEAGRLSLLSPARAQVGAEGWAFNGSAPIAFTAITARRALQDDTDSNLKSMQDSAKKLKAKNDANAPGTKPARKLRVRWAFGENPFPTAEPFNQQAIQQLVHLSAIGF